MVEAFTFPSPKKYLNRINLVIDDTPAMLQQKKQQEVEEQHNQLCTSKVGCLLLMDPVMKIVLFCK